MTPNLKVISAEEADVLWEMGIPIWYKSTMYDWREEPYDPSMKPFWVRWVEFLPTSSPQIAVEVE